MPFKNHDDKKRYQRERARKMRRAKGIPIRTRMSKEQQLLNQRKASRKHYNSNLEQERARTKKWKKDNPEKQRFIEKRRRSRKINAEGSHTHEQWIELKNQYGCRCVRCQKHESEVKLTQDHIIPLSKGGTDYIDNIQPLCFSCNSSKQDSVIEMFETYLLKFAS